ncbi:HEAT repeat-containing protein 8 [Chelonia mydas]|uniref:HEAT repeat-containing protein 8 n=1 Tax=Chelonia mydas TaxID=8469 RepID=M7AXH9_CHEMY|nr:HEAT repeat-containing protein 8 [Chelonia mydas]
MDGHSLPGEEEEDAAAEGTSTMGGEEHSSGSQWEPEPAREDTQDGPAVVIPNQSGPILRCLKRICQKAKRGKARYLRTVTTVPDISRMETIWEVDESGHGQHGCAMEEAMLLLESWRNTIDYFNSNKEEMIKKEPQDSLSSTIRLQAMATIIDLSKKHVVKAMGSHQRRVLLRTFLKSVFSLPLLTTLQVQGVIRSTSAQYTKAVFIGTLQTLNEMLQSLILENPVPSELERILQLMDSWMQSREDCLRERAVWSSILLLNFVATSVKLDLFGVYFNPRERTDFILTVMDGLTDHCNNNCQPTAEGLLSAMVNSGVTKVEKAADLVAGVCSRLDSVQQPSSRTLMMKLVGLLAGEAEHLDTVISCLLDYSFPTNSNLAELWQFLSADPALGGQVMENLVVKLQSHHSSEHQASHTSAAAINPRERTDFILTVMDGLTDHCNNNCQPTAEGLLSAMVNSGVTKVEKAADLVAGVCSRLDSVQQPSSRTLMMKLVGLPGGEAEHLDTVISCLLDYSFPTNRAMLHYACPETTRMLLDLVIPLLDRGDEKHRLTTMAFFVELLRYKEAEKLQHPDTLDRLEEWTKHPSPVFRSLGLRGLGILATQPGKVEQVKALLPAILWDSDEVDDGSILEAISAVQNLLQSLDGNELTSVARKLIPLLSAVRPQMRSAAITLFTELLNTVKRRQKHLLLEEVTRSLVPLLLHLQDEDPDTGKRCQKALAGCFQLLGWAWPKQINSKKAWHDHPQMVDKICQHSVLKLKSISDILLQCLDHLQSPQAPVRRAAAVFIGNHCFS